MDRRQAHAGKGVPSRHGKIQPCCGPWVVGGTVRSFDIAHQGYIGNREGRNSEPMRSLVLSPCLGRKVLNICYDT